MRRKGRLKSNKRQRRKTDRSWASECSEIWPSQNLALLSQETGALYSMALLSHFRYVAQYLFYDTYPLKVNNFVSLSVFIEPYRYRVRLPV